jgi:serine protease Do
MARFFAEVTRAVRRPVLVTIVAGALVLPSLSLPAFARGPDGIADVAERVIDAVVNISTSQTVEAKGGPQATPQLPPGSPFEEFFEGFQEPPRLGDNNQAPNRNTPRRVNSLGLALSSSLAS